MTARETLDLCRKQRQIVHLWAALIDTIAFPGNGCRSPQLTGMPRGGNDNLRAAVERLEYAEKGFAQASIDMDRLAASTEVIICGLETWEKVLMRAYYIDAKTDTEVAALMGWDARETACRRRMEILENMQ